MCPVSSASIPLDWGCETAIRKLDREDRVYCLTFHKRHFFRSFRDNRSMALPSSLNNDQAEVVRVLDEYYSAFSTLKIEAVLPYFHEPSLLLGPQGAFAATTHTLLATAVVPTMESLQARGFGRTELSVRSLKSLSATATLVGGVAQRYKVDGQELDQAGVTYVLHRADGRWKITVLIIHDPDEAP
jgi:hypothetical protein